MESRRVLKATAAVGYKNDSFTVSSVFVSTSDSSRSDDTVE